MEGTRVWAAAACTAALAAGALIGARIAPTAGAQEEPGEQSATFTATPEQLRINQRISQAAVRRSNRSLNYLAPIRTAASDSADEGDAGVRRGTGRGWGAEQIADGAITRAKLAPGLEGAQPIWLVKTDNGPNATMRASSPAHSLARVGVGNYRVGVGVDVATCAWTALPAVDNGLPSAYAIRSARDLTEPGRILLQTYTSLGVPIDSGFSIQVTC